MTVLASNEEAGTASVATGSATPRQADGREGVWPRRWPGAVQVTLATVLFAVAVAPPLDALADTDVRLHHLLHAAIIAAGALLGRPAAAWLRQQRADVSLPAPRPAAWLWAVVSLGPLVLMVAMVPATSPFVDQHVGVHVAEHLGLLLGAGLMAGAGARLASSIGWLVVFSLPLMAALFAGLVAASP